MNILKFKTNRSQNAYKISLNIKRFINQWTKQFYLVNFSKRLSLITRIPKDVILYIIAKLGTNSGTGFFCEYAGNVFEEMTMEGRMTVCNMSIEMGARGGMIAPDQTTFDYVKGKEFAPKGEEFDQKYSLTKQTILDLHASKLKFKSRNYLINYKLIYFKYKYL